MCVSVDLPASAPSALELIKTAIEKAGFTDKVVIGMDVAASEFFIEGKYDLDFKSPPNASRHISAKELADIYQGFINNYPGVYSNACVSLWSVCDNPTEIRVGGGTQLKGCERTGWALLTARLPSSGFHRRPFRSG